MQETTGDTVSAQELSMNRHEGVMSNRPLRAFSHIMPTPDAIEIHVYSWSLWEMNTRDTSTPTTGA
jgi:hypothetical protein